MNGKLLVVEDEFVIAQDLRRICTNLGYVIMGMARSVKEALSQIEMERPDLILLDIKVEGKLTGIDLAHIIDKKLQIPYIYVTSYSDSDILNQMNATNPVGYILKPFDERDIRVALEIGYSKINDRIVSKNSKKAISAVNESDFPIIGESKSIKDALKKVSQVASTDVTVLIHGETGTGKELFMQAVQKMSNRNDKILIKVNCAALPVNLIESVLFGHEKGSFTGATEKRIGKFELADGGTIFLDEIGELPLSSQAKLLRCLQEKEIETVGGSVSKKVDIRIIAATNKDLAEEVRIGNFRADLFFRLNIFPIYVPPLRDREDDIILLANFFLKNVTDKMQKNVNLISSKTMEDFKRYNWPGNVRELQHCIERGVILAESNEVSITIENPNLKGYARHHEEFQLKSFEETERELIVQTLNYCKGKIRGKDGAAEILKMHPNTLDFRIKKLGIKKSIYHSKEE
ncbi:sigma-54 dependent transcriptional regulator [Flavivirga amylovorans]|uniref:Sigma-54 dependent transcriptional regulator n=1 Tax=Flavivirga amylovorans TaxID=870486 RepID=A0ABT8X205_9FLAO|nr:sigma-54 dependent transcriptional regulator [Flavivirga amylovorans]MDO5987610.1 sigma-54 dependent transcriptional regulator [Flavivirga amylovorans]